MANIFNADEVYQMGVEIENNGKEFYEIAAEKAENPDMKSFYKDLAGWENKHISLFEELRSELPDKETENVGFDTDNQKHLYLKAAADTHIFRKNLNIENIVAGCKTPEDVLNIAIQFEKDSVVFYNTMMTLVPDNLGRDKIQRLIDEEISHISILNERMKLFE
jgi:rubrerythrin